MSATADTPERPPLDPQSRTAGRLAAVQALYQIEVTQDPPDRILKDFLAGKVGGLAVAEDKETEQETIVALAEIDGELFINLVRAVQTRGGEIDDMIKGSISAEWPWDRLEITLRSILRAGAAELLTRTDIPANATVAEFVDVARAFYAGPEAGMTNAVLDRIARALGRTSGARAAPAGHEPHARSEFDAIAAYFAPLSKNAPGAFDLKDDAAAVSLGPDRDAVVTVDTVIEGVHFLPDDPPDQVARKALRVNLSDLAAKGAEPVGFLQALSVNASITDTFLEAYAKGLAADVEYYGMPLLGGDTTSGPGPLTVSITAIGAVPKGKMIRRYGARPGDALCVTGTVGDAALGLSYLRGKLKLPREQASALVTRYRLPDPRLVAGAALRTVATSCLDVSDGLIADIGHICAVSNVAAIIEQTKVPLSAAARGVLSREPERWPDILGGGDDYELAFTVPDAEIAKLNALAETAGTSLTVIGRIVAPEDAKLGAVTVVDGAGVPSKSRWPGIGIGNEDEGRGDPMKRAIVIILVLLLVAGGGAGGLMMLGVIPNPFNPTQLGAGMTDAEKAAADMAARKFQPPKAQLDLVKLDDMIVPVIMDGQVNRRVFIIARLVVDKPANVTLVKDSLRVYQDQALRDLVPFFQKYFLDHDTVSAEVVKERLIAAAKTVYGEKVPNVLLINVFEQTSPRQR